MSKTQYRKVASLNMDGINLRGKFPLGHAWKIQIAIKENPHSEDRRQHLLAVIFEGKCSCGKKLFLGVPAPNCWAFTSHVSSVFNTFLDECLLGIYEDHFRGYAMYA